MCMENSSWSNEKALFRRSELSGQLQINYFDPCSEQNLECTGKEKVFKAKEANRNSSKMQEQDVLANKDW